MRGDSASLKRECRAAAPWRVGDSSAEAQPGGGLLAEDPARNGRCDAVRVLDRPGARLIERYWCDHDICGRFDGAAQVARRIVEQQQLPEVDSAVTAKSLAYLTGKSDASKVVIQGIQVFIGFNTKRKGEELAAIVNEAALRYADATGRDIYVHGTHLEQIASIGTPSLSRVLQHPCRGRLARRRRPVHQEAGDDRKHLLIGKPPRRAQ